MSNITSEFHDIINAKSTASLNVQDAKKYAPKNKNKKENYDMFIKEAYRIYQHIDSLNRFLLSIRRAYLNNNTRKSRNLPSTNINNNSKINTSSSNSLFSMFPTNITHLTDNERDEIDFQAKLIIRKCMDRIKELEEAEILRKKQTNTTTANRFAQFLNQVISSANFNMDTEDILSLHHNNIIWLLNKLLTDVSKLQRDQQEIRLTRELEKSENHLFNSTSITKEIITPTNDQPFTSSPLGINWKPTKSTITTSINNNNNNNNNSIPLNTIHQQQQDQDLTYAHDDMDAFEQQLSQEQIQLLEKENEAMLEEMNGTLNQVKQAEKALLEISALQTQLANHLAVQTMQTDRLYGDSLATNERVEQGNLQLQQARERNRGTRKFMLVFLLGASFVLLFLDWYS